MATPSLLTTDEIPSLLENGFRLYKTVPTFMVVAEQEQQVIRKLGHDAVLLASDQHMAGQSMCFIYWKPKQRSLRSQATAPLAPPVPDTTTG